MKKSDEQFHVLTLDAHNRLIAAVYTQRGYSEEESRLAAEMAAEASWHGIRTHNAIKALHIEEANRGHGGGSVPGAQVRRLPGRFAASEVWDAQFRLGQAVALEAMATCMTLADKYGVGQVSVDNASHYIWGGGYVLRAARSGYIGYTNCTASVAEVVPYQGRFPTLGTNPHSWAFPTQDIVGFPMLIDWATSVIAMSRVWQCQREGKPLPPGAAVNAEGKPTTMPEAVRALLPFGAHKGYGLGLINEIMSAMIGGSLPTLRNRGPVHGEKHGATCYFQVIHPEAVSADAFTGGRSQLENIRAVLADILGHGNENCMLPGQIEAEAAKCSQRNGGLLFSGKEIEALNQLADEAGQDRLDISLLPVAK